MNTDCTKPSVAPKPRFVCHASLKLPPPLMAAARGPKPFIAPKPKVTLELNGNQGGCSNGCLLSLDGKLNEEHETQNHHHKVATDTSPVKKQINNYILKSPQTDLWTMLQTPEDGEVTEGGKEVEEDIIQKTDEDWKLIDSALTKDGNSLEALWVHDMKLTAESREPAEIIVAEVTEDMDPGGCNAGEALADADGLSVGDLSVNGIDVDTDCYSAKHEDMEKREKLQTIDRSRVDEMIEFPTNEPELSYNEKGADTESTQVFLREDKEEESVSDCGFTCNILKLRCGHRIKEKVDDQQNICFDHFVPEVRKQAAKIHPAIDNYSSLEPVYISSEDIINREPMMRSDNAHETSDSPLTQTHTSFLKSTAFSVRPYGGVTNERTASDLSDYNSHVLGDRLNHLDCYPTFKQVPMDTDTSMTSSLSDSQLLSPSDSDVFEDELDGHIVPFLDDTTDTEQDISDEPVYEEPGKSFKPENGFPSDKKVAGMKLGSFSRYPINNMEDSGAQFTQKTYMSGFGQPALSSSPMLGAGRHKSNSKPYYLSLYPRSLSMEGQDMPLGIYKEGSPRQRGALCSSDSFSRHSPLSSSALSTPTSVVDIPPPFELSYITKKPITKSSPSLLIEGDTADKNRKKKSSIKRFLMLKFRWKTESKPVADVNSSSFKSSVDSNHHTPSRLLDSDRHSVSSSPKLNSHLVYKHQISPDSPSTFLLYNQSKRKGNSVAFLNRSVVRVESFEDRSRVPFTSLPLTKPRSISFPNTDTSDYENVPPISSDYENIQVPQRWPIRQVPYSDFFERPRRVLSTANETDGYVDMSSLPGFEKKIQSSEQEAESAYTEAYNVCSVAVGPTLGSNGGCEMVGEEDQGRTSDEEGGTDNNYDRPPDGRSRAFYIAKELLDTERLHVKALKMLQEDFRESVGSTVGDEGEPVVSDERLREIFNELPDVYTLHRTILNELEDRLRHWEERPRIADIFLLRKAEFLVFTTYIGHYDRSMNLLEDSCETSPAFAAIVEQFEEQSGCGKKVTIKHQLLQVIVRVAQYRMLLTDYLNNLSPDSREYEDTQATVAFVSDIADQVNDTLKHGENLLRLVNIEYSVHGQRDLLQPGRFFVKEGTLMKVSRKNRQPRHLFLMNDVLLYTYPQQDGKYRLKNTLTLTGLKISKPSIEDAQNALKIEGTDISITLSASSFIEREDWFYTLNRTINEDLRDSGAFSSCSGESRDRLQLSLGEKAPTLVPVSQVMMCMNCTSDFSLTLRRHHCHGCGRIVCRSCSRNRYPLKYMNDRMAKVCDHCYTELKKRGDVPALSGKSSPSPHRSTRPLSAVFQNIHPPNIWKHRKGTLTFNQMTVCDEGSIRGSLQRSKKSKRNWKKLWFLLKDKVLYTYRAQEETVASESLPLLGFTVRLHDMHYGDSETNVFQLYHKNTLFYTFKAEDNYTAQRWANAMEEATIL